MPRGPREKLIGLLDYIEQVVRLDERVAFRISEYRLPDGTSFAIEEGVTRNLPGVHHDVRDEEGSAWLEIARLSRREPPPPPPEIAEWIILSSDPARRPEARSQRIVTVTAVERDAAIANNEVRAEDVVEAPRRGDAAPGTPTLFDLTFRLEDRPAIASAIEIWIAGPWTAWATEEMPRRRTIALYQQLYKVFQLVEVGGTESHIEVVWGLGVVHWQKEGYVVDRPLLERRVDVELDDAHGGLIRIRPTSADATFDLKPYEELGCNGLPGLADLIRREITRAGQDEGISPFVRESFEPILAAAASRLDPEGCYAPDATQPEGVGKVGDSSKLTVTNKWILFARPRSQHVILQDIARLRNAAEDNEKPIGGIAERLVTEPSKVSKQAQWEPLDTRLGGPVAEVTPTEEFRDISFDIFFPKVFNDDQLEIVRRLSGEDGLVVQGPPGTGKTHTIANLICHAMATGHRVLVVSRGEAALSVLRDQLPKEVQPLAIAVLSNEREGLRQIERATREIQAVIDGVRPENRRRAIRRLEAEIDGLRKRVGEIDYELDAIAAAHLSKMGPRGEPPAQLAQRIASERTTFEWFVDRPLRFASETGLDEQVMQELAVARRRIGDLIDHLGIVLPSPADLPAADDVARWHDDLVRAGELTEIAARGPVRSIRVTAETVSQVLQVAEALEAVGQTHLAISEAGWLHPFRRAAIRGEQTSWCAVLRERIVEWVEVETERAQLLKRPVGLPPDLLEDQDARLAIDRAAAGQRLWPLFSLGKTASKARVSSIKLNGFGLKQDDLVGWRHVAAVVANLTRRHEVATRWNAFAGEVGAPVGPNSKSAIEVAKAVLVAADSLRTHASHLGLVAPTVGLETLAEEPNLCISLSAQIKAAVGAVRLAAAQGHIRRISAQFKHRSDRTSSAVRPFLDEYVGKRSVNTQKVQTVWQSVLQRLESLKGRARDFETIDVVTRQIAAAGAPKWANRLRTEPVTQGDHVLSPTWRDAWDHGAADANLTRIDARDRLLALAQERESADKQCRKLFAELVRERTFDELDRRLSPSVKSALVEFVRALARIGKGTGKTAGIHRRSAREAMSRCYDAVPCWIMPTWRVAEQLPAELGVLDLVIIDEASQSDVTELPALLRGRKILVVGDDRQVSPTAPFVTQAKIAQLRHHYLGDLPFKSLLEPGESIYDLMRAVFPSQRLMLKEHFRCVEPIIQFSMQFYPEKMLPLRIPSANERLEPPLVDIFVPHGAREKRRKINHVEADVIVNEISSITKQPGMENRSLGVISLIGSEQAEYIRARLSETIGEELMQRHGLLCGDSATFQGTERDIVFLSMVTDSAHKTALTMLRYEQRFNVAVSRARDRVILVRSVRREDLQPSDLKARLIAHFENPMPTSAERTSEELDECDSGFERDVMRRLLDRGYRVQGQVGSLGFRIDMVVEGADGRRLAIECDGDRFHGPEQWRDDMRRQRVLERVGWRFWRCFASSFYRDPDRVSSELFDTLTRMGIEPLGKTETARPSQKYTEHRIIHPPAQTGWPLSMAAADTLSDVDPLKGEDPLSVSEGIGVGDKVVLLFADDRHKISSRLTEGTNDLEKGLLSIASPLGRAILGAEDGDEIEFRLDDGRKRKVLIESVDKERAR